MRIKNSFIVSSLIFALTCPIFAVDSRLYSDSTSLIFNDGINVFVSGKVKTPEGRGIKGARIVLKDADTNEIVRVALSSPFGYYRLDQIEAGRSYVLSVSHKSYIFAFPAQLIELNENRTGLDFLGELND